MDSSKIHGWQISTGKDALIALVLAAATAKSLQSCPTLCDPRDGSPPGSPVPGSLQARTLEWVAISFSNAQKWKVKVKSLSRVQPSATPWTAAFQAPLSMGFSRQEYWSGVTLPSLLPCYRITINKCRRIGKNGKSPLSKYHSNDWYRTEILWYMLKHTTNSKVWWETRFSVSKHFL